jgi:hypothetical protein
MNNDRTKVTNGLLAGMGDQFDSQPYNRFPQELDTSTSKRDSISPIRNSQGDPNHAVGSSTLDRFVG